MTDEPDEFDQLDDRSLIDVVMAVERLRPEIIEAVAISKLSEMPREHYLAAIQLIERRRSTKGL